MSFEHRERDITLSFGSFSAAKRALDRTIEAPDDEVDEEEKALAVDAREELVERWNAARGTERDPTGDGDG